MGQRNLTERAANDESEEESQGQDRSKRGATVGAGAAAVVDIMTFCVSWKGRRGEINAKADDRQLTERMDEFLSVCECCVCCVHVSL